MKFAELMLCMTTSWLWHIIASMDNIFEILCRIAMYLLALCLAILTITLIMRPVSDIFGRVLGIICLVLAVPTVYRWYMLRKRS